VLLRFVVASDGHYGEKNTAYDQYFATLVEQINKQRLQTPFAFCVINGDIVHDDKVHYPAAKTALDNLQLQYYVTQGNHDHVTPEEWELTWKMPVNHSFQIGKNTMLLCTTSDDKGTYLCPDVKWIESQLEEHRQQDHVFIFMHINPVKLSKYGVDCPELLDVFSKYKNVKAVFNGHDHDEEGIKTRNNIPFIFDAHFGGSWGTSYRGFRIVELLADHSMATYIMDPLAKINEVVV